HGNEEDLAPREDGEEARQILRAAHQQRPQRLHVPAVDAGHVDGVALLARPVEQLRVGIDGDVEREELVHLLEESQLVCLAGVAGPLDDLPGRLLPALPVVHPVDHLVPGVVV
ncbi:MAG: hypothetical protein ACK56I_28450, partial [bacterium]